MEHPEYVAVYLLWGVRVQGWQVDGVREPHRLQLPRSLQSPPPFPPLKLTPPLAVFKSPCASPHLSGSLYVFLSRSLSIYLSTYLPTYLPIYLSIALVDALWCKLVIVLFLSCLKIATFSKLLSAHRLLIVFGQTNISHLSLSVTHACEHGRARSLARSTPSLSSPSLFQSSSSAPSRARTSAMPSACSPGASPSERRVPSVPRSEPGEGPPQANVFLCCPRGREAQGFRGSGA